VRIYNTFIVALAVTFTLITLVMSLFQVAGLDAYFAVYTIALLILMALFTVFSPRARRNLNQVGIGAFGGFLVIVGVKVVEILSGK
jgi:hypothetical protein